MDKLLDAGTWTRLTLSIVPSLLFVISVLLLFGYTPATGTQSEAVWLHGLFTVAATVLLSILLEELSGYFEARIVDMRLYPRARGKRKARQFRAQTRQVSRSVYTNHFLTIWERYLSLAPTAERVVRWSYYEYVVHRYRVLTSTTLSLFLTGLLWMAAGSLTVPKDAEPRMWIWVAHHEICMGAGLAALGAALAWFELPSTAALLHWHRIHLIRSNRAVKQGKTGARRTTPTAPTTRWIKRRSR